MDQQENKLLAWFKRLGLAGFLFFLGKGLLWIALWLGLWECMK